MTIRQLADQEGITKTGVRNILQKLGLLDQLERDEAGILQLSDDQAEAVHAWRRRKAEPETRPGTDQQMESSGRTASAASYRQAADTDGQNADTDGQAAAGADRQAESADQTARLLVLLESDLAVLRDQLAVKDAEIAALHAQLAVKDEQLRTLGKALEASTGTTLADSGRKLLEADNQQRGRLRRVWDALMGR